MNEDPGQTTTTKEARSIADSPWFWGYLFSAAALVALALASPKYSSRQRQLERQFLARQEGGQTIKGSDGVSIDVPYEDNLIVSLLPLFVICGSLLIVAWSRFWWSRFATTMNSRREPKETPLP